MYRYRQIQQLLRELPINILTEDEHISYQASSINHLELIFENFRELGWLYHRLVNNENCTLKMVIIDRMSIENMEALVANKAFTFEDIIKIPEFKSKWQAASANKNITIEIFEAHPQLDWDYFKLAKNPNFPVNYLRNNANKDPIWQQIIVKINQLEGLFRGLRERSDDYYFDLHKAMKKSLPFRSLKYSGYCRHQLTDISSYINLKYVIDNPSLTWDFQKLSSNKTLTISAIRRFPISIWCWSSISENRAITMENIINNKDLPWNWAYVINNPNMTVKWFMDKIQTYDKRKFSIERNPNIDFRTYPYSPITIGKLCSNLYLTSDDILLNPDYKWNYLNIAGNPMNGRTKLIVRKLKHYKANIRYLYRFIDRSLYFSTISKDLIHSIAMYL